MTNNTVSDATEMRVVKAQNSPVRSTVSLPIQSVAGNTLNNLVAAGHMQKAAMRALVSPSLIKDVFGPR